jgi:hypothetical protein
MAITLQTLGVLSAILLSIARNASASNAEVINFANTAAISTNDTNYFASFESQLDDGAEQFSELFSKLTEADIEMLLTNAKLTDDGKVLLLMLGVRLTRENDAFWRRMVTKLGTEVAGEHMYCEHGLFGIGPDGYNASLYTKKKLVLSRFTFPSAAGAEHTVVISEFNDETNGRRSTWWIADQRTHPTNIVLLFRLNRGWLRLSTN